MEDKKGNYMGLIIIGLVISYLCWVTKRGAEYVDERSEGIIKRRKKIEEKLKNKEKLTIFEMSDFYTTKILYGGLKYGVYGGFVVSIIGVIQWIIK